MSIRKSPQLSSSLLGAARSNARRSHGPRTPAGKQHSKMNGLKHGERSDPENFQEVMRALGEDPAQFAALKQELRDSFVPSDAFFEKQIDDLARLYWRRDRIERMETGLMRRALEAVEEGQYVLRRTLAAATFDPTPTATMDLDLPLPNDRCVRLRQLLSLLGVITEQVKRKEFTPRQTAVLRTYYQDKVGWRAGRIGQLLQPYLEWLQHEEYRHDETYKHYMPNPEPLPQPGPEHHQELLRLLAEERAAVEAEYQHEVEVREEKAAIERDACLAPSGEEWKMLLRREETLDRSIDRKIKLLLGLRKEAAQPQKPPAAGQTCSARSAALDGDRTNRGPERQVRATPPVEATAPPAVESKALSRGESDLRTPMGSIGPQKSGRVSRSGAFISRSVTGEGSVDAPEDGRPMPAGKAGEPAVSRDEKIDDRSVNVDENKEEPTSAAGQRQDPTASAQGGQGAEFGVSVA